MDFFTQEITISDSAIPNSQVLYCRSQGPPVWYEVRAPRTSSDYKCLLRCQDPEGEDPRQGRTPMRALYPLSRLGIKGLKTLGRHKGKKGFPRKGMLGTPSQLCEKPVTSSTVIIFIKTKMLHGLTRRVQRTGQENRKL